MVLGKISIIFYMVYDITEENAYLLCKKLCTSGVADAEGSDLFVVFISNEKKQVPLWHQKASQRADGVVLWDYHVICIQKQHFCLQNSDIAMTVTEKKRFFRVVHAPIFLRSFASDRRHMKDSVGNLIAQPPAYEAIVAEDGTVHNVNEYIEISTAGLAKDIGVDLIDAVHSQKLGVTAKLGVQGSDGLMGWFKFNPSYLESYLGLNCNPRLYN
ncbi:hypothetical protein ACSBR2_034096 [Camellia fascicularis]